jgi:hypothetical protein
MPVLCGLDARSLGLPPYPGSPVCGGPKMRNCLTPGRGPVICWLCAGHPVTRKRERAAAQEPTPSAPTSSIPVTVDRTCQGDPSGRPVRPAIDRSSRCGLGLTTFGNLICGMRQLMLDHGLRAPANVTLERTLNVTLPGRGTVTHRRRIVIDVKRVRFESVRSCEGADPSQLSVAPDLRKPSLVVRSTPAGCLPRAHAFEHSPLAGCVTPIPDAEHDCKGVHAGAGALWRTPAWVPFAPWQASCVSLTG